MAMYILWEHIQVFPVSMIHQIGYYVIKKKTEQYLHILPLCTNIGFNLPLPVNQIPVECKCV